jgi:hypothetical protein
MLAVYFPENFVNLYQIIRRHILKIVIVDIKMNLKRTVCDVETFAFLACYVVYFIAVYPTFQEGLSVLSIRKGHGCEGGGKLRSAGFKWLQRRRNVNISNKKK